MRAHRLRGLDVGQAVGACGLGMTHKREMTKLPFAGGKYFGWRKWEEMGGNSTITSLFLYMFVECEDGDYVKYIKMVLRGQGVATAVNLGKQKDEGVTRNNVTANEVHGKEASRILDNVMIFGVELVNVVTKKEGEHITFDIFVHQYSLKMPNVRW
jgi:hypothetical protein